MGKLVCIFCARQGGESQGQALRGEGGLAEEQHRGLLTAGQPMPVLSCAHRWCRGVCNQDNKALTILCAVSMLYHDVRVQTLMQQPTQPQMLS
jgi:hypothetical protein